jgi:hypothetical protein
MTQTIINLGTAGALLNGRNGSTSGADSNDARFLDWPGDNAGNYVYLPGVAGNFMSVPDAVNLQLLDDLEIVAYVDFASGVGGTIASKGGVNNNVSYRFNISAANLLQLVTGFGASNDSRASTVALPSNRGWVKVTRNKAASEIKFFTSPDGSTWTQLGDTRDYSGASANNNNAAVQLGQQSTSSSPADGNIYRTIIRDGIDGNVVLDVDTSVITSGAATSFIALTGQTVTINRSTSGRKSVAVVSPVWLFGTDDFMEVANSDLLNPAAGAPFSVVAVFRMFDIATGQPIITTRTISTAATQAGWTVRTGTSNAVAYVDDEANIASRSLTPYTNGALSVNGFTLDATDMRGIVAGGLTATTSRPAGSQRSARPLRIGVRADTLADYAAMELVAVAVFNRTLSASEVSQLTAYYQARLS